MHIPDSCLEGKVKAIWTLYFPVGSLTFENNVVQTESACLAGEWYLMWPQKVTFSTLQKSVAWNNVIHTAKQKLGQTAIRGSILGVYLFLSCIFRWNGWKMKTSLILLKIGTFILLLITTSSSSRPASRILQTILVLPKTLSPRGKARPQLS